MNKNQDEETKGYFIDWATQTHSEFLYIMSGDIQQNTSFWILT